MEDLHGVELLEALGDLNEDIPNVIFLDQLTLFLLLDNSLVEVAIVIVVHDDAQLLLVLFHKGFFVLHHIRVADASQNTNFIYCILFLLF